jgi:hypothetical protein
MLNQQEEVPSDGMEPSEKKEEHFAGLEFEEIKAMERIVTWAIGTT